MKSPGAEGKETMLTSLIRYRIAEVGGTQASYAEHLGINEKTVRRWLNQESDPLAITKKDTDLKERFINDLGYDLETLKVLGEITIPQACETVLSVHNLLISEHEQ